MLYERWRSIAIVVDPLENSVEPCCESGSAHYRPKILVKTLRDSFESSGRQSLQRIRVRIVNQSKAGICMWTRLSVGPHSRLAFLAIKLGNAWPL